MDIIAGNDLEQILKKCNPLLYKLIYNHNLHTNLFAYLVEYNYGDQLADVNNFYYHFKNNLTTIEGLPSRIQKDLDLYSNHIPFSLIANKSVEMAIDNDSSSIPVTLYKAGDLFGFNSRLGTNYKSFYSPPLISSFAGTRSTFSVSNLGNLSLFSSLKNKLPEDVSAPKTLQEHHSFFKAIYNSYKTDSMEWKLKILVFPGRFLKNIINNRNYREIKCYLNELYWQKSEQTRNKQNYDFISSEIFSSLQAFKPDPYITGTIRHFISIFTDIYPSFTVLENNDQIPKDLIQKVLISEYKIKTDPTLIGLEYFSKANILYYALNYPTTFTYARDNVKQQTIATKLDNLSRLSKAFFKKYEQLDIASITNIYKLLPDITMHCFHTDTFKSRTIKSVNILPDIDKSMEFSLFGLGLPKSSPFLRGVIAFEKHQH